MKSKYKLPCDECDNLSHHTEKIGGLWLCYDCARKHKTIIQKVAEMIYQKTIILNAKEKINIKECAFTKEQVAWAELRAEELFGKRGFSKYVRFLIECDMEAGGVNELRE